MSRGIRLTALALAAGLGLPVLFSPVLAGAPAETDLPTDQSRTVVFELFTPPEVSGGGG
jgi:hypothetical protein